MATFHDAFVRNIFPPEWVNPEPKQEYDLVVVGAGPGGMTAAMHAARSGARVALVESEHFGGECLSFGCIPSKAFLRSSRIAHEIGKANEYGCNVPENWRVDFPAVMNRVRMLQLALSPHDSPLNFKKLGIDIFLGEASFSRPNRLEVAAKSLNFKKALIMTGTRPIPLGLPGLQEADYLTNETVFGLTELPGRLAVIGGGPISCELSQGFARLGAEVILVSHNAQLLPRDEPATGERLRQLFEKEGISVLTETNLLRVEKRDSEKLIFVDSRKEPIVADAMLVAIGRQPALAGLALEKAGVIADPVKGIKTDDFLLTSNPSIYAAGDVASAYKFTHSSVEFGKIAVENALFAKGRKASSLIIPWCTYTDPEVAHIGLTEAEVVKKDLPFETVQIEMSDVDRAVVDGQTQGFAKLIVKEGSQQILGATIMAAHAGEMISELSVAMQAEDGLRLLSQAIHPFPTQASILRQAAETLLLRRASNRISI